MSRQPEASTQVEAATRLERILDRPAVACVLFLALAVMLTWPLVVRLGSAVPAGTIDMWQNYWNFWWWKTSLLEGRSPYWTPYLFHPTGTPVVFHTHSPFNMIVGLPVTLLFGPGAAYGFCVLLALWLSGFGAYLLARDVTGSSRAAAIAGVVYAFFPQLLERSLEQLNLSTVQFLPLAVWAFLRLARAGGLRRVVALGVFFTLNALADWHLALKLVLLLVPLALIALIRPSRPRGALCRDFAAAAAVAALLTLPFAWPLLRGMASGARYQKETVERGVDAAFLLRPHFHHPLWGSLTRDAYAERRGYQAVGFVCYLGFAPLILAAVAIVRRPRETRFWALVFAGTLVLALGKHPWWNGRLLESITLPFGMLEAVPFLSLLRNANRFLILTSLALSLLAAFGWAGFRNRADGRFLFVLALVILDYLWVPYPLRENRLSPYYASLASTGPRGAVLDLPFYLGVTTVRNMRAQVVHGRPIAGGYLSVLDPANLRSVQAEPALADLFGLNPPLARSLDRERLQALGFGVAILHKAQPAHPWRHSAAAWKAEDLFDHRIAIAQGAGPEGRDVPDDKLRALRERLEEACGPPIWEDEEIAAFDLTRGS